MNYYNTQVKQVILPTTPLIPVKDEKIGVSVTKKNMDALHLDQTTLKLWNKWVKIQEEYYYYKDINYIYTFLNELLGEQISKFFRLETVHYELAFKTFKKSSLKSFGLLSKNFRTSNTTYLEATDLGLSRFSNLDLFTHLEAYNEEGKYTALLSDLKKMVIRDLYAQQLDRLNTNNFFFQVKKDVIRLSPLHDYEQSLETPSLKYVNLFSSMDLENPKTRKYIENDEEFLNLIQKIFLINMKELLQGIEKYYQITISDYHKQYYIDYDNQVKEKVKKIFP